MPLQRRIPKRGFKNIHRVTFQVVNVRDLNRIEAGEVTPEVLLNHGLISTLRQPVKILGMGEIEGSFQVSAHRFSGSAREKIEKAGGSISVLTGSKAGTPDETSAPEPLAAEAVEDSADQAEAAEEAPSPEGDGASEAEDEKA